MRNIIAGTAGHIDHGKTALVRALTGVDTDRLEEEKRRGISIDLGFAHLQLQENIRLALIDVPGHERFIKNMLAGVGGIDFVLFIIAADESIKPQTREHFDICRLLRIPNGIIVLTKIDLVDPEILDLVRLEVDEFVSGSFLESAPVIGVSSTTGQGIEELRKEMAALASRIADRDATRWFRMPIDRAFTMRGFGTVVTGTLVAGAVGIEEEVELYPEGRRVRVRGVQVHGQAVKRATAGQRTALNLANVEVAELERGMVLAAPGRFRATKRIDTVFELLAGAQPLRHNAPVHFHAGTAEVEAEARLLESNLPMQPGTKTAVRFLLRTPLLLLPGDRFIVRMFSPVVTIGGGEVVDFDVNPRVRRPAAAARVAKLEKATAAERVAMLVKESAYGLSVEELIRRTGLTAEEMARLAGGRSWMVDAAFLDAKAKAVQAALTAFHRANPLVPGMSKEDLRSRELAGAPAFLLDTILGGMKTVVAEGDVVRLASHQVALKGDEEAALAKIEAAFAGAGLAVPAMSAVLAGSGVEAARARSLLQILMRDRRLLKIGDDLVFHHTALAKLKELLASHKGHRFGVPEFKDWTGVSRKYAIPLLEYLDREKITRRDGESRVVL